MSVSRAAAEEFLYHEAALLDEWRLEDWLALFTQDAVYEVPPAGAAPDADAKTSLFYIADDYARLCHRVRRLLKPGAHSEFPHSRTTRMIGNVRVVQADDDGADIACNFTTRRAKNSITDVYFGHQTYRLQTAGGLKIRAKRSFIAADNLRPQGRVSIIL